MGTDMENRVEAGNSGTNSGIIVAQNDGTINIQRPPSLVKLPSHITTIIKNLGEICFEEDNLKITDDLVIFKTEDKIRYNNVIKYRDIIKNYSQFYTMCDEVLNAYDNSNIGSKKKILFCIKTWYLVCKGEFLKAKKNKKDSDIDVIRRNADEIIDAVICKIKDIILSSSNNKSIDIEDIEVGLPCFICYAFMECKVLEKPQ